MDTLKLLETYGLSKKDWEDISSLRLYFSDKFRKELGEKTKEFVSNELPVSSKLLEELNLSKVFNSTIENFFDILFQPEKLTMQLNSIATMHARFEVPPEDFVRAFLAFFRYILKNADIPPEKIPAFREFIFILVSTLTSIVVYHWFTERKEREIDSITKLPSKKLLILNFSKLIKSSRTIVLLDIDKFNRINLHYGYRAGNSVLSFIASTLRLEFKEDFIARFQSDDFIILTKLSQEDVLKKLKNLRKALEEKPITVPTKFGIKEIKLSFYAAVLNTNLLPEVDFGVLNWILWNALEKAKWSSFSGIKVVRANDVKIGTDKRKKALDVINAIEKGMLKVALQDVIDIRTNQTVFKEVLARIILENSIIPAEEFIKIISGSNIERELDKLVVEKTIELLKSGKIKSKISINLSTEFIKSHSGWLLNLIKSNGIKPSNLIVELTERRDSLESVEVIRNIYRLKENGIKIYIDDFGIKYANYNLLKELPVDGIKIDGSIVKNLDREHVDQAFVECVLQIAKLRNLEIVAEYVETEETKRQLEQMANKYRVNSLYIQGYLFGKPKVIS